MAAPIILCDTKNMSRKEWLMARKHGPSGDIPYTVGGSDIAVIFGVSPWTTPLELWHRKKGRLPEEDKSNANQLEYGHLAEDITAHFYGKRTGNLVINDTNLYRHATKGYALANFDRRYIRAEDGEEGILELKTTSYHKADTWEGGACPIYYELQLRYYMAVADLEHGSFCAMWGNNPDTDMAMPALSRDREMEDMIFARTDEWIWSLNNDREPSLAGVDPEMAMSAFARAYEKTLKKKPQIELPQSLEADVRRILCLQDELRSARARERQLEKELAAHSVPIAEFMKEYEYGILNAPGGNVLIDFAAKTTRRVSSDKLKKAYPDVYEECLSPSVSRKLKASIQKE